MTRVHGGCALTLALVSLVGAPGCNRERAPVAAAAEPPPGEVWLSDRQVVDAKIKVEHLDEQDVDDVVLTGGKVTFDDAHVSHVFSPVSGRIMRIESSPGQRVKRGGVLAVLESPEIGLASADLQKAEADRVTAEHDLQRQKELLAAHASSQRDYEQAEDAHRKALAEVDRARQKARLFRANTGGQVTQMFSIRAEIDGEVVARNVSPGAEVQGQYGGGTAVELFTIGELNRVWVVADVYEMDIPRVKVGSKANIKLVALPGKSFPASVEWIAGTLDPSTRTAKVRCSLDNTARLFRPEMYATLAITVEERKALAIPRTALLRLGNDTAVFVEKGHSPDGRRAFVRTPVTVDESEGSRWVPIGAGPDRGAPIVTEGAILLAGAR